jgi:MFS family permease
LWWPLTAIPGLLAAPLVGSVIDRFGRRRIAIWSEVLTVVTSLIDSRSSRATGSSRLPALIVIGMLRAMVAPGGGTARKSLIPDVATPANMTLDRANSIHEGLFATGFAIGPALATFLHCLVWLGQYPSWWLAAFGRYLGTLCSNDSSSRAAGGEGRQRHWQRLQVRNPGLCGAVLQPTRFLDDGSHQ